MIKFLNQFCEAFLDIIAPPLCLNCRRLVLKGEYLCRECFSSVKLNDSFHCAACFKRAPENKKICHPSSYLIGAAASYDEPSIKALVHCLKYRSFESSAETLGQFVLKFIENSEVGIAGYVIVPVPLSGKRMRQRGFNQAEAIAKAISRTLKLPLETNAIVRIRYTVPQTEVKSKKERLKNVAECFIATDPENVAGKKIVLVDDVFTSGATMNEAVNTLKKAGARKVIALVAAKAQLNA